MDTVTIGSAIHAVSEAVNTTDYATFVVAVISVLSFVMHFFKGKNQ